MSEQRPSRVEEPKYDPYTGELLEERSISTTKLTGNMSDKSGKKSKKGFSFEIHLNEKQFLVVCLVIFALTYLTSLAFTLTTLGVVLTFILWTIVVYGLMILGTFAGRGRIFEVPDQDDNDTDQD